MCWVAAQRRDQRLQDVPLLSVSAMASESLERVKIRQIYDLQTQVPALNINRYEKWHGLIRSRRWIR
jgi:hypothetical protein